MQADIAALRKSNAALKAAAEDNGYVADEADAALNRAIADYEASHIELVSVDRQVMFSHR